VVKVSPELVMGPERGKSSGRVVTFSLWTGMFWDGISSGANLGLGGLGSCLER